MKWQGTFSFPGLLLQDFCSHQKRAVLYDLLNSVQAVINKKKQEQISLHIPTRNFVKWRGIFNGQLSFDNIFSAVICLKSVKNG